MIHSKTTLRNILATVLVATCGSAIASPGSMVRTSASVGTNVDFTRAAESTVNSVVSIKNFANPRYNSSSMNPFMDDPFFEFFFGPQQRQQPEQKEGEPVQQGLGSGVIISPEGYIVTNNHVIDGADRLDVVLNDNRTFNATVIGADPVTDIALIKIEADGLHAIRMGDSDDLKIGEWVLAVGNPFGFTSTVTSGIVSAKARSISSKTGSRRRNGQMGVESYIQTDAAVNPGNSGGALVNLNGELVGINTAIYSNTGSYSGYSFAVPISLVSKVVDDLLTYGTVQRAVLGVTIQNLTSELAKKHNIEGYSEGVLVTGFADHSSAREAGIEEDDLLIEFDGVPLKSVSQLQELVGRHRPGDRVKITYVRNNKRHTADIKLINTQGNTEVSTRGQFTDLGCAFVTLDKQKCRELGISSGVQVKGVQDGKMRKQGVKDGFIITKVNNQRVSSLEDIERIYNSIMQEDGDHVLFLTGMYPTGKNQYYAIPLD